MFRKRFLIYIRHNERYATHFFHDLICRAHCKQQCDICEQADQVHNLKVTTALDNFRASYSSNNPTRFQPCVRDFQTSHHLRKTIVNGILCHECSFECTLPIVRQIVFIHFVIVACWIMHFTKFFYLLNNYYTAVVILCTMTFIMMWFPYSKTQTC